MPPAIAAVGSLLTAVLVEGAVLTTFQAFIVSTLINIAAANYARNHQPETPKPADNRRHTGRTNNSPLVILYGTRRTSGPLVRWATGIAGNTIISPDTSVELDAEKAIVMAIAIAEHELDGLEEIYYAERLGYSTIGGTVDTTLSGKDFFTMYLGTANQTSDYTLSQINNDNLWTAEHKGEGVAYLVVYLHDYGDWDSLPDISIVARGAKIYDPRKDSTNGGSGTHLYTDPTTWEYSNNPALVARDYLTREEGFGEDHAKIDDAVTIQSANACDVQVDTPGDAFPSGPYIKQNMYSCDLSVAMNASRKDNLQEILETMRGRVVYIGGKWKIMAGEFTVPTVTLTEDDVLGDFSVSQSTSAASTYNYVTGTYYDKARYYQNANFIPQENSAFEARDNGRRISRELQLTGVTNEYQAQRLATLELNASAHQTIISCTLKPSGNVLDLYAGSLVDVTLDNPAWTDKPFRILTWELNPDLSVKVTMKDENPEAWDVPVTIYLNTLDEPHYDPYNPSLVNKPLNVSFETGTSVAKTLTSGTLQPIGRLAWDTPSGSMLSGYRVRWRPASIATSFSEGIEELNPQFYFKGDETTGLVATNSAPTVVTGRYEEDASTAGMSVTGLNSNEVGTAIFTGAIKERILTVENTSDIVISRDFTAAIIFKVDTPELNTCIMGQWGETLATQAFKLGTLSNSFNIGVTVRDIGLTTYEIDSGSDYNDGLPHLAIVTMSGNTLYLEIDGETIATRNLEGVTLIFNSDNPYFIGGGPSSETDTPIDPDTSVLSATPTYFWKLDEEDGIAALDTMGLGNLEYESDASTVGYSGITSTADGLGVSKAIDGNTGLQIYDPANVGEPPLPPTDYLAYWTMDTLDTIEVSPLDYYGHYKCDEGAGTLVESSGGGASNIIVSGTGATYSHGGFGDGGTSIYRSGINVYVSSSSPGFDSPSFTGCIWVKCGTQNPTGFACGVMTRHGTTAQGYGLEIRKSNQRPFFQIGNTSFTVINATTAINDNAWHHLAFSYDGDEDQNICRWSYGKLLQQEFHSHNLQINQYT